MKILEEKYPKGSLPGQKTAGRYVDGYLYENMDLLSKKIVDDMTFLMFVFSSTLEVGTGKSVFVSQLGELWTHLVKKNHKIDLPFGMNNCVFKPEDLIERSFQVPKYSFIWLDEWEDAHYWSKLGVSLRQFFRKCRQLNLCIVCIVPNFFQIPMGYAISRSVAAIDVSFEGNFDRGYFSFYNFKAKKDLFIKGKKFHSYSVVKPNFRGRFTKGYAVNEKEYREAKYRDMVEADEKKELTEQDINKKHAMKLSEEGWGKKRIAEFFGVSERTIFRWFEKGNEDTVELGGVSYDVVKPPQYNKILTTKEKQHE